jgi:osmotically-inducible protein OsmY
VASAPQRAFTRRAGSPNEDAKIMKTNLLAATAVLLSAATLSGCVGVNVTAQERPFERAFSDFSARTDMNARMLAEDPRLFANVSTTVLEGRVHLAGTVNSEAERQRAQQLASATPGVLEVINNIEITQGGGILETVDDRWIAGQVRAAILTDGTIRDSNYTIDTQNNIVYVMGIAQNEGELQKVLNHAASVRGVRQVVNYAVLKDDPSRQRPVANTAPVYDYTRPQAKNEQPPVLTGDMNQGVAQSGGAMPQPVEVAPLPADPTQATGAPRPLLR